MIKVADSTSVNEYLKKIDIFSVRNVTMQTKMSRSTKETEISSPWQLSQIQYLTKRRKNTNNYSFTLVYSNLCIKNVYDKIAPIITFDCFWI